TNASDPKQEYYFWAYQNHGPYPAVPLQDENWIGDYVIKANGVYLDNFKFVIGNWTGSEVSLREFIVEWR
ncbi:MAG TPA: hypothetical protein PLP59_12355, partial [Thermotogota bacterium]|nr:hypothetical protein [Thermotogota bacterium]